VTVIDAGGQAPVHRSVNAGWIVPSLAGPVPAPGVMGTALRWLLRPGSPLRMSLGMSLADARWLYGFWRATSAARYRAGLVATARLGASSFALYDLLAAEGHAFQMHRDGVLFGYRHVDAMERIAGNSGELEPSGTPCRSVDRRWGGESNRRCRVASGGYIDEGGRSVQRESLMASLERA